MNNETEHRLRRWLKLTPTWNCPPVHIRETYNHEIDIICNRIWYRGDPDELRQFFGTQHQTDASCSRFWSAVPNGGSVRKIHSGLPADIVDTLSNLVVSDYDGCTFKEDIQDVTWKTIEEKIGFEGILDTAIRETLITGDGAFKVIWDFDSSPYPTAEFLGADRVIYHFFGSAICGISFFTNYDFKDLHIMYQLEERYTPGKIQYVLRNTDGYIVPLNTISETAKLHDIELPNNLLAAVPLRFFTSNRWSGRGKSIYANKTDAFDAHDETVSQWMDALRSGRVQKYIPEDLIPRDSSCLRLLSPSPFDSKFVRINGSKDESQNSQIETIQPDIQYEAFVSSYVTTLDMCLRGVLSPATLGIDVSAMSSGESQRERKDITGFTRNAITGELARKLPVLITLLLQINDWVGKRELGKYAPTVSFGEYATPDFNERVQTLSAAADSGIMSTETLVSELWGGSKDTAWVSEEAERIKAEKGVD